MSDLFGPPILDPTKLPNRFILGTISYTLEKLYASESPTTHHFVGRPHLERFVGKGKPGQEFWLISDPGGCASRRAEVVRTYASYKAAQKACERFGAALDIRFLVARKLLEFNYR